MMKVLERLQEAWLFKLCTSCILTLISYTHVRLFAAFAVLVSSIY